MRLWSIGLGVLLVMGVAGVAQSAEVSKPVVIDLLPGPGPGEKGTIGEEKATSHPTGDISPWDIHSIGGSTRADRRALARLAPRRRAAGPA